MSPTNLETISVTISGSRYGMFSVVSSRITVSEIVIRVTPPSIDAAPISAYVPGCTTYALPSGALASAAATAAPPSAAHSRQAAQYLLLVQLAG